MLSNPIQIRFILGSNTSIISAGYGSTECAIGAPHDPNILDEFALESDDVVEFLEVSQDEAHKNICQGVSIVRSVLMFAS